MTTAYARPVRCHTCSEPTGEVLRSPEEAPTSLTCVNCTDVPLDGGHVETGVQCPHCGCMSFTLHEPAVVLYRGSSEEVDEDGVVYFSSYDTMYGEGEGSPYIECNGCSATVTDDIPWEFG